uniref:Calcineurin-like phosphoesterase n=1 Tax=Desulfovibrio sp. U5L TaxID=596152 RepID=I2Q722_9BACT
MASNDTPDTDGKLIAIGDIHGQSDALRRLLDDLPYRPGRDRLIFLGDYINRGPDTRGVLEVLSALRRDDPGAVFCLGNHEEALLRYAAGGDPEDLRLLRTLGIETTLESYGDLTAASLAGLSFLPEEHREFLLGLESFRRIGPYVFVHAGLPGGLPPEACPPDCLLSVRGAFLTGPVPEGLTVVFGHTTSRTPLVAPGKIGLDTGAAWGGALTALVLPDMVFLHAPGDRFLPATKPVKS